MKTFTWNLAHGRSLDIGARSLIMGIVNVTPDSFSDGGLFLDPGQAVDHALKLLEDGADILDIGGESTRPGAVEISQEEEEQRIMPIIERLVRETNAILSVDTFKEKTALRALEAGAHIINDVYSLRRSPIIAQYVADYKAGLVVMRTGRERDRLPDVLDDQKFFLESSLHIAKKAGVLNENIVIDPGFGFHQDIDEDIKLLCGFEDLLTFEYPVLIGISRKRIIGELGKAPPGSRDVGTTACSVFLRCKGASIFRVHDVLMNRQALNVIDSLLIYENKKQKP